MQSRTPQLPPPRGRIQLDDEPDVRGADEVFRVLRGWHMATTLGDAVERAGDAVGELVRGNVAYGRTVTAAQLDVAVQTRSRLLAAAAEFWSRHDYLLMPVSQVLVPRVWSPLAPSCSTSA